MSRPEKFKEEYIRIAEHACLLGATDQEIADMLGVAVRTIYNWRAAHPEFAEALKGGKETADERVERSLYQRAIGYEQDDVKIFMPSGATEPVYAPYRAKVAADVTAAIFWLKNRRSDEWRDVKHIDGRQQVTHKYDLDSLGEEKLRELERILADAERGTGSTGEEIASSVH